MPEKYSKELGRIIAWMLRVHSEERPSVDDLLNVPQISLRIREKRFKENQRVLQKKKEEFEKKEMQIIAKEKVVKNLEGIIKCKREELKKIENRVKRLKSTKHITYNATTDINLELKKIKDKDFKTIDTRNVGMHIDRKSVV